MNLSDMRRVRRSLLRALCLTIATHSMHLPSACTQSIFLPDDKLGDYLTSCQVVRQKLDEVCRTQKSCSGRCGRAVTTKSAYNFDAGAMCSCDALCLVYDDCCQDFKRHCPAQLHEFHQFYTPLSQAEHGCVNNYAVITGCPRDYPMVQINYTKDANLLNPIISSSFNPSIQYLNSIIYSCHSNCSNRTIHDNGSGIVWDVMVTVPKDAVAVPIIQKVLKNEPNVASLLSMSPPTSLKFEARMCNIGLQLNCKNEVTMHNITQSNNCFPSTNISSQQLVKYCYRGSYETAKWEPDAPMTTTTVAKADEGYICYPRSLITRPPRGTLEMQILMQIKDGELNLQPISSSDWQKASCRLEDCHLSLNLQCKLGLFFDGVDCVYPVSLSLTLVGADDVEDRLVTTQILKEILNEIEGTFLSLIDTRETQNMRQVLAGTGMKIEGFSPTLVYSVDEYLLLDVQDNDHFNLTISKIVDEKLECFKTKLPKDLAISLCLTYYTHASNATGDNDVMKRCDVLTSPYDVHSLTSCNIAGSSDTPGNGSGSNGVILSLAVLMSYLILRVLLE